MSQESPARTPTKSNPALSAPLTERTGIPVFIELPPLPPAATVAPAPAVASQFAASPATELIQSLQDSSADTACEAAIALGKLDDCAAVAPLIEVVENRSGYFHSVVRAAACASLGQLGDRSATPALINAIDDPRAETSAEAIRALAALGDERAVEPLTAVLRNAEGFFAPLVCHTAAGALRQFKSPQAAAALTTFAADFNEVLAVAAPPVNLPEITYDLIAESAYEIWEKSGRPDGRASENWLQAETQLRANRSAIDRSR